MLFVFGASSKNSVFMTMELFLAQAKGYIFVPSLKAKTKPSAFTGFAIIDI
jgi:hypothetical protein